VKLRSLKYDLVRCNTTKFSLRLLDARVAAMWTLQFFCWLFLHWSMVCLMI